MGALSYLRSAELPSRPCTQTMRCSPSGESTRHSSDTWKYGTVEASPLKSLGRRREREINV